MWPGLLGRLEGCLALTLELLWTKVPSLHSLGTWEGSLAMVLAEPT